MGIERVQFHWALVRYGGSFYFSLDKLTRLKHKNTDNVS